MSPIASEVKAQIVAAILEGQGVNEVADKYKVSNATVSRLKKALEEDVSDVTKDCNEKNKPIADLVIAHLKASLNAASNIANIANQPDWLSKQDAAELGAFYGILSDKAVRILEALEASGEDSVDTPAETEAGS